MPGKISISPRARPENILLVGFKSDKLKPLTGKIAGRSRENARQRSGRNDHGSDPGRRIAH